MWGSLAAVLAVGCNPITLTAILLQGDQKLPAKFPLKAPEGKKEVTVAVLCEHTGQPPAEFAGADRQLPGLLAKKFPDILKANEIKETVTVVPPAQVDRFKASNPKWRAFGAKSIGQRLGADYVLDVYLAGMQLYQPGSVNMLYDGRAEVTVDVYEVGGTDDAPKYQYVHAFKYPPGYVRDATSIPASQFKIGFMESLANELVLYHVEHKQSTGIAAENR